MYTPCEVSAAAHISLKGIQLRIVCRRPILRMVSGTILSISLVRILDGFTPRQESILSLPALAVDFLTATCAARDRFKIQVQERIEKELIPYGLHVTNANVAELKDMEGVDNRYFDSLKQKAIAGATNDARIEVCDCICVSPWHRIWCICRSGGMPCIYVYAPLSVRETITENSPENTSWINTARYAVCAYDCINQF